MNVLVYFGGRICKINIVSIHQMLEHEISQTKGRDQWTHDTITYCDREYSYDPGILHTIVEFEGGVHPHGQTLGRRSRPEHFYQIQQEIGQSEKVKGRANKGASGHVFEKKGTIVRHTAPLYVVCVLGADPLKHRVYARQPERWQYENLNNINLD